MWPTASCLRVILGIKKYEETLQQLCTKADKAWKDTNDLVSTTSCVMMENCWLSLQTLRGPPRKNGMLDKLPTVPIDLSYHRPIPMMLAYGPESYAYQTWCKDRGETSALSGEVRASCILTWKLKWLAHGKGVNDTSSNRSASLAHSTCSAVPLPEMLFILIPFPV